VKTVNFMFICKGNICRSPLAQSVFEQMAGSEGLSDSLFAESSGTGAWHLGEEADPRMRRTAKNHGVVINHRSRRLTSRDLSDFHLLLTMDRHNFRDTIDLCRSEDERKKVRMFRDFDPEGPGDVPDPWYGGSEGFEEVWAIVRRTCINLITLIRSGELKYLSACSPSGDSL
jgi:protein-tyrosine phosphatase